MVWNQTRWRRRLTESLKSKVRFNMISFKWLKEIRWVEIVISNTVRRGEVHVSRPRSSNLWVRTLEMTLSRRNYRVSIWTIAEHGMRIVQVGRTLWATKTISEASSAPCEMYKEFNRKAIAITTIKAGKTTSTDPQTVKTRWIHSIKFPSDMKTHHSWTIWESRPSSTHLRKMPWRHWISSRMYRRTYRRVRIKMITISMSLQAMWHRKSTHWVVSLVLISTWTPSFTRMITSIHLHLWLKERTNWVCKNPKERAGLKLAVNAEVGLQSLGWKSKTMMMERFRAWRKPSKPMINSAAITATDLIWKSFASRGTISNLTWDCRNMNKWTCALSILKQISRQ